MIRSAKSVLATAIALGMTGAGVSCALVGYNFDDYDPANTGGGGAGGTGNGPASSQGPASGSGGSGMGGATGSGTGGGSAENCVNGTDDDNDGQIDCADTECPGFTCVQEAPVGWTGPVAFWQGQGAPPACLPGTSTVQQGSSGALTAPPASCMCSCSAPQGTTCTDHQSVTFHSNDECSMPAQTITAPDGVCMPTPGNTGSASGSTPSVINVGGCQPTLTSNIPPASFAESALMCGGALVEGGCGAGNVCGPVAAAPFSANHCIYQAGDVACPIATYTVKTTLYTSIADTRGCAACGCGSPIVQCTGTTYFYMDACMSTPYHSVTVPCSGGIAATGYMKYISSSSGACSPSGGVPTGTAQGGDPVTVCCPPP